MKLISMKLLNCFEFALGTVPITVILFPFTLTTVPWLPAHPCCNMFAVKAFMSASRLSALLLNALIETKTMAGKGKRMSKST